MDELTQAFYNVMYKYEKHFSAQGVKANLDVWRENKSALITMLRNHPGWNEQEMAIVFDLTEGRTIDRDVVDECKFGLIDLANEMNLSQEQHSSFKLALEAAAAEYSKTPSEPYIETIRECGGIKCAVGQKASRIINKLCVKFGIDRHEQFNPVFARLADALNPIAIQKTGVLSVHPCDFLEMSNKDSTWQSCHKLNGGAYQSGCLSYMTDSTSMIFITVDENIHSDFHKSPRLAREIFCYANHVLLQSRLYPSDDDGQRQLYRGLVQKAIADCLGAPNLWSVIKQQDQVNEYLETTEHSRHYPDYEYGYGIVCFLKGAPEHGIITIGHRSICVCCGEMFNQSSAIKCECADMVVCQDCGETVPADNAHYIDGAYHCNSCLHVCADCGHMIYGEMFGAFDSHGYPVEICGSCHERRLAPCQRCSVRSICQVITADRFCTRIAVAAA